MGDSMENASGGSMGGSVGGSVGSWADWGGWEGLV